MMDKCEFCKGTKSGVPGNENVIDGVIVCDYCSSLLWKMENHGKNAVAKMLSKLEEQRVYWENQECPRDYGGTDPVLYQEYCNGRVCQCEDLIDFVKNELLKGE